MSKAEEIKAQRVAALLEDTDYKFVQFKGALLFAGPETHGFRPLTEKAFAPILYSHYSGVSKSNIADILHNIAAMAPDWSHTSHFIGFHDQVWDMRTLQFAENQLEFVYSSDIAPQPKGSAGYKAAKQYLLELAAGDKELARDYLQAIAPLFMERRPSGVIWFVGDGANGKSSLINALYRLLGQYFSSMTIAAIEDGRDTPFLNGKLGNICRESSESRVEDTERYKAIGTHEPFTVHKFHSQDNIEVTTDFHTIFNANNIPAFSDKTQGARRRTLIVPFPAHFADNPTFEDATFTSEFLGGLLTLLLDTAKNLASQGYRYRWSDQTLRAKEAYDSEVNSAEAFVSYLTQSSIAGFYNFTILKNAYETWCGQHGLVPLGVTTLRRTINTTVGAIRKSVRVDGKVVSRYFFAEAVDEELTWLDNGYGIAAPSDEIVVETVPNERISDEW